MAAETAWDEPARRALRSYRLRAWGLLAAGVVLLIGFMVAASVVEGRADKLDRTGAHVPGVITDVQGQGERGAVVVSFVWQGAGRSTRVHLNASSPRYRTGQDVDVVVDRADPDHVSLPGETNQSPATTYPMIFALVGGAVLLGAATASLFRARRQRRLLQRSTWRRTPVTYDEIRTRAGARPVLQIDSGTVRLSTVPVWRLKKSGLRDATEVEVAGDVDRHAVVRVAGGRLLSVRPPRNATR